MIIFSCRTFPIEAQVYIFVHIYLQTHTKMADNCMQTETRQVKLNKLIVTIDSSTKMAKIIVKFLVKKNSEVSVRVPITPLLQKEHLHRV